MTITVYDPATYKDAAFVGTPTIPLFDTTITCYAGGGTLDELFTIGYGTNFGSPRTIAISNFIVNGVLISNDPLHETGPGGIAYLFISGNSGIGFTVVAQAQTTINPGWKVTMHITTS